MIKNKYCLGSCYSIIINPSFEIGYDIVVVDSFEDKVISSSTICVYHLDELFDYIEDIIKEYEVLKYDK